MAEFQNSRDNDFGEAPSKYDEENVQNCGDNMFSTHRDDSPVVTNKDDHEDENMSNVDQRESFDFAPETKSADMQHGSLEKSSESTHPDEEGEKDEGSTPTEVLREPDIIEPLEASPHVGGSPVLTSSENLTSNQGTTIIPTVEELQLQSEKSYRMKDIRFGPINHRIVTQNKNGPCPLLAIINAMVLRGDTVLPARDSKQVANEELVQLLAEHLLRPKPKMAVGGTEDFEKNLEDAIQLLPSLSNGLDVNVGFSGVTDFEFTPELALFDLVNISLYHAWIPDPQLKVIHDAVAPLKYNELVTKMCDETNHSREFLREFLEESNSQLTFHGLSELLGRMKDGEIAVLFRNNHFYTLHKRRDELFTLATDEGFAKESAIVWESLSSVDGDSFFVNADFHTYSPTPTTAMDATAQDQRQQAADADELERLNKDFLLAMKLQKEEEAVAANEENATNAALPVSTRTDSGAHSPSSGTKSPPDNRKSNKCAIM